MKWRDFVKTCRGERSKTQPVEVIIKILVAVVWDMVLDIENLKKRIEYLEGTAGNVR